MRGSFTARIVAITFVMLIAGCPQKPADNGGEPADPTLVTFTDPQTAVAKVKLPAGVSTDVTTLKVATNVDDTPIGSDGASVPQVIVDFPSLVLLVGPDNKTLLMSFLSPGAADQEVSAKSTAVALLYFALGAWNTPPQNAQNILDRIAASQAATTLAAAIETAMASNPTALTDGNQAITDAIKAGAQTLINDNTPGPTSKIIRGAKSILQTLMAASNFQLLISPDATTIQSGVQVLQNPDGDGVIAQNNFRRRAAMYAYLVGTKAGENDDVKPVNPPQQTGEPVDIPTTYSLGLFSSFSQAAQNVVGGGGVAPWSPIRTGPLVLPREGSAAESLYKVVVVGPAFDATGPHNVLADDAFANFHTQWNDKITALSMQTFLEDFAFRVLEFIAIAGPASVNRATAAQAIAEYRGSLDPILLAAGLAIPLRSPVSFRDALSLIVKDAANPGSLVLKPKTLKFLQDMWGVDTAAKAKLAQLDANLSRAARIGGLLVAIDVALSGLDLGAVIHDLTASKTSEAWDATVVPRKVNIDPVAPTLTQTNKSVEFAASVAQNPNGIFLYRWTCTATHGHLHDFASDNQDNFDTGTANRTFYVADPSAELTGIVDSVTVSIYESDGSGKISDKTNFIGSATANISGPPTTCDFPEADYNVGTNLQMTITPNVVAQGGQITVNVSYTFDDTHTGGVRLYLGDGCGFCFAYKASGGQDFTCGCGKAEFDKTLINGTRPGGLDSTRKLIGVGQNQGLTPVTVSCAIVVPVPFDVPPPDPVTKVPFHGRLSTTVVYTVSPDYRPCQVGHADCGCPSIYSSASQPDDTWIGRFVVATAGSEIAVRHFNFAVDPTFTTTAGTGPPLCP